MKITGLLFAIALLLICSTNAVGQKRSKTYLVSGEVKYSSFYQGGVDQGDIIPELFPLRNQEFILVRLDSLNGKPRKVDQVMTDNEGKFNLKLEPGIYGFVLKENLRDLQLGQFTPTIEHSGGNGLSSTVRWDFIGLSPIVVKNEAVVNIQLLRHTSTICYECP